MHARGGPRDGFQADPITRPSTDQGNTDQPNTDHEAAMAKKKIEDGAPIIIKKYANRRLYNTNTSSYVTLDDLCAMVKSDIDFVVYDAKSEEDITRSVLTQIIFEQEAKGENLLPIGFLRQLIGYYDDHLKALVPSYLEVAMENFSNNHEQIQHNLEETFGDLFPFNQMQEMGKQNMALFEQALSMFTPGSPERGNGQTAGQTTEQTAGQASPGAPEQKPSPEPNKEMHDLHAQLDRMQKQLDALSRKE
jgi:polyhydroxyalkanoate synthesis repressor PhaR